MSRYSGLGGIFLPFLHIDKYDNRYVKNEDAYLYKIKDVLDEEENLLKYGRFMNEFIALASWKISMFDLYSDIDIPNSDLHEDKIHSLISMGDYNVGMVKKSKKQRGRNRSRNRNRKSKKKRNRKYNRKSK